METNHDWNSTQVPLLKKLNALGKGKRVMETIPNPESIQTNKPFIKVHMERKFKWSITFQIMQKRWSHSKQFSGSFAILRTGIKAIWSRVMHIASTVPFTWPGTSSLIRTAPQGQDSECILKPFEFLWIEKTHKKRGEPLSKKRPEPSWNAMKRIVKKQNRVLR